MDRKERPFPELERRVADMKREQLQSPDGRIPNNPLSVAERIDAGPKSYDPDGGSP